MEPCAALDVAGGQADEAKLQTAIEWFQNDWFGGSVEILQRAVNEYPGASPETIAQAEEIIHGGDQRPDWSTKGS